MIELSIKKNDFKKDWLIQCLAILALIIAYGVGSLKSQNDIEEKIRTQLPSKTLVKISSSPVVFTVFDKTTRQSQGWLVITEQQGWGGPMEVGAWINSNGILEKLIILDHRETPVFFEILEKRKYFDQYTQKNIQDPFQLHQDIEGISGATVSSQAIAEAAKRSTHYWGRNHFKFAIEKAPLQWQIGANEFILIVLYAVIVIAAVKKYRKIRYITLAFSIVFLGFYLSAPISISAFGALLMGYVPSITGQFFWWLLVLGAILMAVIIGRNLYCAWACPFGGIQEFIHRAGGMSVRIHPAVKRWATRIVYFLFWLAFMAMFLTDNPAIGTFEPFAALFSFKGSGIQWYLVSVAIFGSFIIPRFWCRFFCPVGLALKMLAKTKKQILRRFATKWQNSRREHPETCIAQRKAA